jgi:undecaprenyl-diphosphatase
MIGLISSLDQFLFHLANGAWVSPMLDRLMPALSVAGNAGALWLVSLGVLAILGGNTGRRMALAGLLGLAAGFLASDLVKEITMRPRPFAALPDVRLLVPEPGSYAFPSGHTTSAFAAASGTVLAAKRLLGRVPAWGWGMLALAAAIAYSRIYVGVHWPTDDAAGMLVGTACGWSASRLATRRGKSEGQDRPEETRDASEEAPEVECQPIRYRGGDETRNTHTAGGGRPLDRRLLQART